MRAWPLIPLAFLLGILIGYGASPGASPGQTGAQTPAVLGPYFSPEDRCSEVVVSWISRAENSLDLAVYSFTHQGIAEALVGAHRRGVAVRVILEEEQAGERSQRPLLENAGIPVRLDTNPYLMHHKFLVVDGRAVLLGSFNYTVSADTRNDEDLLVVEDPSVARAFLEEFEEMWGGVYGR